MDRFDAMQAFVRVAETGSFTRAATDLGLARATVTQLVQQLEARLRVRLLDRTTRRVSLTADGSAFLERALRLLADLDDAETGLPGQAAAARGRLRVDMPSPLARLVVVPALPAFHARHPEIELVLGASDRVVDLMGANVDCVVRGGELADGSLVARRLARLALGVYAAPAYLERHGTPAHPGELEGAAHRSVGFLWASSGRPLQPVLRRGTEQVQVRARPRLAVDDGNAYQAAVLAGAGRGLDAALHGRRARGARRAGGAVRGLAAGADAAVAGLASATAGRGAPACLHRLDGGTDGAVRRRLRLS